MTCNEKRPCARSQTMIDSRNHWKNLHSDWCISLVAFCAVMHTVTLHLGRRKMSFELIHWLLSFLRVIRHRKMCDCLSNHTLRPEPMCHISLKLVLFCQKVSVGRLFYRLVFTVLHPGRMKTDVLLCLLSIRSACILSVFVSVYFLLWRIQVFIHCREDFEDENISTDVFRCGSGSVRLIDLESD